MATDYFSDHEMFSSSQPLQSPSDTASLAPLSRKSSRLGSPLTDTAESPPPLPSAASKAHDDLDDGVHFDPRRFTPNLHANLVSEILNLRRELESKDRFIEDLEGTLSEAKVENDSLHDQANKTAKENRKFKHQLQELEKGTLAALEDLARDRDETHSTNTDLKKKLDDAQKKIRTQQEDSDRAHKLFESDKDSWSNEKRGLERRVHVSETRLKVVLDELQNQAHRHENSMESEPEDQTRDSGFGNESDTTSIRSASRMGADSRASTRHRRTISNSSYGRSVRYSVLGHTSVDGFAKSNGLSLADELNLDEEDEDLEDMATDSDDFPEHELRARRALESRQSNHTADVKAKKILGLTENRPSTMTPDEGIRPTPHTAIEPIPEPIMEPFKVPEVTRPPSQPAYVDNAVQFTPPSPPLSAQEPAQPKVEYVDAGVQFSPEEPKEPEKAIPQYADSGVQPSRPSSPEAPVIPEAEVVSAAAQTTEPYPVIEEAPVVVEPETCSTSTQTDLPTPSQPSPESVAPPVPTRAPPRPPSPILVPSITIHPPQSTPNSPKEGILPPGTRNASCQVTIESPIPTRSTSMQTEPIRVDKRPVKLPPHLLPSALASYLEPEKPKPEVADQKPERKPLKISTTMDSSTPVRNAISAPNSASTVHTEDRYPGNNDNGPLNRERAEGIRRPFRSSSLFAGFDGGSSDEDNSEDDITDYEDGRTSVASRTRGSRLKGGRPFTPVPEEKETSHSNGSDDPSGKGKAVIYDTQAVNGRTSFDRATDPSESGRGSFEKPSKVSKQSRGGSASRSSSIRRSALISSGAAAHLQRSRSPSLGSVPAGHPMPPFPVPTRSSSRRVPLSKSEGSPTSSRSQATFNSRRAPGHRQPQRDSLRKIRSATSMPRNGRPRSRSPPLPTSPYDWDAAPQIPPLRNGVLASPMSSAPGTKRISHLSQPSTNTSFTGNASSTGSGPQISVVDAIAATMVGEWMWKYVRRGAFGVSTSQQELVKSSEDGAVNVSSATGVRHKRWVWLSPYERSIMWSSKQPTSGTALMGKSGRKLTIQSVLDVHDDSPHPKGANPQEVFSRSILVLTPARALKFTATSRERHYLWLTALSFLAHSVGPLGDEINPSLLSLSPAEPAHSPVVTPPVLREPAPKSHNATLRRSHIRDSVRLAKSKDHLRPRRPTLHGTIDELNDPESPPPPMPDLNGDAATPPTIPRFSQHAVASQGHGRKRSLTGPRPAPPSNPSTANGLPHGFLRSFSSQTHQAHKHAPSSATASTNSDNYYHSVGMPPSVPSSLYNPSSTRTSEADSSLRNNFFEALGTHRMEAFVGAVQPPSSTYRGRYGSTSEASDGSAAIPPPVPRMKAGRGYSGKVWEEDVDPFRGF
jgi:hypothetical protein